MQFIFLVLTLECPSVIQIQSMLSNEHLKEFGFEDLSKFPRILMDHSVTVSLPSAVSHQLEPVHVIIHRGLAIPVQMPGVPNGMVIRSDGKMVFVAHEQPRDFTSPLKVTFTEDIAYDIRIEAYNIMLRAVEVDRSLQAVWTEILDHWVQWYPPDGKEIKFQSGGTFRDIQKALAGLEQFLDKFGAQVQRESSQPHVIPFKIVVESQEEAGKGWQGEEFRIKESTLGQIMSQGTRPFLNDEIQPKLKETLQNPVFFTQSSFQLYFESRVIPVFKIIVVPPANPDGIELSRGIDL
jgi:hypothetical protein